MASVYQIKRTDGVQTITIQPGTLNGPGGVLANTDLQLYGQGTLAWGAGVDQNLLRILENFAVEEKAGFPRIPKDETDIGVTGAGINNPISGQQWFNLTDSSMYVYDAGTTSWNLVGGVFTGPVAPTLPAEGDLWYDTNAPAQLKVYDSVAVAFVSVAARYLLLTGGVMASGANQTFSGGGEVLGLPAVPSATAAASKEYVDAEITTLYGTATTDFVNVTGDTMTGNITINNTLPPSIVLNATNNTDGSFVLQKVGANRGDFLWDDSANAIFIRKLNDLTVNNTIEINDTHITTMGTVNGKIRTPTTLVADNANTVTTKDYVDAEIIAATAGLGATIPEIFEQAADPGAAAKNGDIWIDTDDVPSTYIKVSGLFRKFYPAQYT